MSEHDHDDEHDKGLSHDLPKILERRRLLGLFGGIAAAGALAACGADDGTGTASSSAPTTSAGSGSSGRTTSGEIPEETAGPYPGDGSNGVNVLTQSGVVRSDIRSSCGRVNSRPARTTALMRRVLRMSASGSPSRRTRSAP